MEKFYQVICLQIMVFGILLELYSHFSILCILNLINKSWRALQILIKESGWLPEWASPGHRQSMIGSNSAPIIADAYLKGNVYEKDKEVLLEAVLKNANINDGRPKQSVGREGIILQLATMYLMMLESMKMLPGH